MALYTFGQFIQPSENSANQGFHQRNDLVLAEVDRAEGLIARSGYAEEPGPDSWGVQVFPKIWQDNGDGWAPSTLSLWQDLETAIGFTFSGLHAEALAQGRQWFRKGDWPPLVAWWSETRPDWAEAVQRYELLCDQGPGPQAFGFKQAFDANGQPLLPDRARIRAIAARAAVHI